VAKEFGGMTTIIAIPAFNEAKNIGRLLTRIGSLNLPADYQVWVINDGSSDNTVEIVLSYQDKLPVSVINHEKNSGVGQAFRTIFKNAVERAHPQDTIVVMEADNTSDPAILNEMVNLTQTGFDVVLASCYASAGKIKGSSPFRIFMSEAANTVVKTFYPIGVQTYSSFYRAYRVDALQKAINFYGDKFIEQPGFVCAVEVLVKLSRLPLRITEVPMVLDINQRVDKSKMKVFRTLMGYANFFARDMVNGQLQFLIKRMLKPKTAS
jgi:dolichol-phosphate mannosyltransferase